MTDAGPSAPSLGRSRWARPVVVGAIAVAALVAAASLGPASDANDFSASGAPRPMPRTQLVSTTLEEFEGILVGLRGAPVVVNIWASWCAPCRAEMPLLQRAAATYAGDVTILGVDSKDTAGPAEDFLDDVGVDYPNVFDSSGDIRKALGLRGFPTTYFFDDTGAIVATVVGGISEARLAAQLDELT